MILLSHPRTCTVCQWEPNISSENCKNGAVGSAACLLAVRKTIWCLASSFEEHPSIHFDQIFAQCFTFCSQLSRLTDNEKSAFRTDPQVDNLVRCYLTGKYCVRNAGQSHSTTGNVISFRISDIPKTV